MRSGEHFRPHGDRRWHWYDPQWTLRHVPVRLYHCGVDEREFLAVPGIRGEGDMTGTPGPFGANYWFETDEDREAYEREKDMTEQAEALAISEWGRKYALLEAENERLRETLGEVHTNGEWLHHERESDWCIATEVYEMVGEALAKQPEEQSDG